MDRDETLLGTNPNLADTDGDTFADGVEALVGTDPLSAASKPDTTGVLQGHWKLDETSGTTAADSTELGSDGTLSNGPVWTNGVMNNALWFNGTNSFVTCGAGGTNSPLAVTNLTVSFWTFVTNKTQTSGTVTRQLPNYHCGHPLKVPIKTRKLRHRLSQPNLFFFG